MNMNLNTHDLGNSQFLSLIFRFRDDVPVDPSFRHEMKEDEAGYQTLTISDVRKSDIGIYKAKFTNTAGWTSCDSKLSLALCKLHNTF